MKKLCAIATGVLLCCTNSSAAWACAAAPMAGQTVSIAQEEALIAWNEATHTEHFIRRAHFRTRAQDFGFLVPTPTQPTLAEVPNTIFDTLERAIEPEVHYASRSYLSPTLSCMCFMLTRGAHAPTAATAVRVLATQQVAGYEAVVLEADSATALANWLQEKGYEFRPTLAQWLAPYVAAHWKITAFRIAKRDAQPGFEGLSTSSVRMTFTTDRPFYPYREPQEQRTESAGTRLLRVFFLGEGRFAGALGNGTPFAATTALAQPLGAPALRRTIEPWREHLPGLSPNGTWLTVFEDRSSPRPGVDDVFFSRASTQGPVAVPPVTYTRDEPIPVPLDFVAFGVAIPWFLYRRRRRALLANGPKQ